MKYRSRETRIEALNIEDDLLKVMLKNAETEISDNDEKLFSCSYFKNLMAIKPFLRDSMSSCTFETFPYFESLFSDNACDLYYIDAIKKLSGALAKSTAIKLDDDTLEALVMYVSQYFILTDAEYVFDPQTKHGSFQVKVLRKKEIPGLFKELEQRKVVDETLYEDAEILGISREQIQEYQRKLAQKYSSKLNQIEHLLERNITLVSGKKLETIPLAKGSNAMQTMQSVLAYNLFMTVRGLNPYISATKTYPIIQSILGVCGMDEYLIKTTDHERIKKVISRIEEFARPHFIATVFELTKIMPTEKKSIYKSFCDHI